MMDRFKQVKLSANQEAIMRLAQLFAILVIVGVVGYSEVMFLDVISTAFPDGFFKIIAMIGGVSTGLSVLTLLLAKAYWFRPGGQTVAAWVFTGLEVLILLLNVLLSFALSHGPLPADDPMGVWYNLCPSSPLFALVGWTILIMLDRSQKERHDHMEMEDEVRVTELNHERAVHAARMKLKASILSSHAAYLEQHIGSQEMQDDIKQAARLIAQEELSSFVGKHIAAMHNDTPASSTPDPSTGPLALPEGTPGATFVNPLNGPLALPEGTLGSTPVEADTRQRVRLNRSDVPRG